MDMYIFRFTTRISFFLRWRRYGSANHTDIWILGHSVIKLDVSMVVYF